MIRSSEFIVSREPIDRIARDGRGHLVAKPINLRIIGECASNLPSSELVGAVDRPGSADPSAQLLNSVFGECVFDNGVGVPVTH